MVYYLKKAIENESTHVDIYHKGLLPTQQVPAVYNRMGLSEVYLAYKISRLLRQKCQETQNYDLVISNQITGWPIRGGKAINIYHGTIARYSEALRNNLPFGYFLQARYIRSQFEKLSGSGKTVVAVTNQVAKELKEAYHLSAEEVIYNGIDTDHFRRLTSSNIKTELGLDEDTFLGLFVGRHEYAKGIDILEQVSRKLPDDVAIATVGNGYANNRFGKIIPIGPKSFDELPYIYSGADFFVFPSRYEACPLAPLEAMACELPVIMSNINIGEEILTRYEVLRDFIVNSFNPDDYLKKILELKSSESTQKEAKKASRKLVCKSFSLSTFGQKYRELVSSLIQQQ